MDKHDEFVDLLAERRKDCDILWVSRPMDPLAPHNLPPESRYSRKQAIQATLSSPRVVLAIESLAVARGVDKSAIEKEARDQLEEMASKARLPTVRWIGFFITKVLKRILLSIRINQQFLLGLKQQMRVSRVQYVYAPSHRSYLDFVLLSYILFSHDMALPNIASGMDFYRMKIVGELLRHTGAFYMRRSFATDLLYKEVFKSYVSSLVAHSDRAIEFFIEGTRSRSQKSIAPKFGLLAMILDGLYRSEVMDIQFVPMSITYDRPLEELLFSYELLGVPKPAESTSGLLKSLSILREPFAHGHVYLRVASPISAREFLDSTVRRKSALSPNAKLPSEVTKRLAYAIIDSHKKHTSLTPFNLIALLVNERVHSHPEEPFYDMDLLLRDYAWVKKFFSDSTKALVHPRVENSKEERREGSEKEEILESLHTHRELLAFDSKGLLKLRERHRDISSEARKNVKGHTLDARTMRMAVPVINLSIYVNPTLAFLTCPAIVASSLCDPEIDREKSLRKYTLLRKLLCTEFALSSEVAESDIAAEWKEGLSLLLKEHCISSTGNYFTASSNAKLLSLLQNLLRPYVVALWITCTAVYRWDEQTMGVSTEQQILKESQKLTAMLLLKESAIVTHPYSLSVDLYSSTLISLVTCGAVTTSEKPVTYKADEVRLSSFLTDLENILEQRNPSGSYIKIAPTFLLPTSIELQAKL